MDGRETQQFSTEKTKEQIREELLNPKSAEQLRSESAGVNQKKFYRLETLDNESLRAGALGREFYRWGGNQKKFYRLETLDNESFRAGALGRFRDFRQRIPECWCAR